MGWSPLVHWERATGILSGVSQSGFATYAVVVVGHHTLSQIYGLWCNKSLWDSLIKSSTPVCRGILWGMSATSDSMLAMWVVVGTSLVVKLSGIL
jgi:hypothetical protein